MNQADEGAGSQDKPLILRLLLSVGFLPILESS
jgi:hypothetical protein